MEAPFHYVYSTSFRQTLSALTTPSWHTDRQRDTHAHTFVLNMTEERKS